MYPWSHLPIPLTIQTALAQDVKTIVWQCLPRFRRKLLYPSSPSWYKQHDPYQTTRCHISRGNNIKLQRRAKFQLSADKHNFASLHKCTIPLPTSEGWATALMLLLVTGSDRSWGKGVYTGVTFGSIVQNVKEGHPFFTLTKKRKGKGKTSPYNRPRTPRGGVQVQLYSFFNLGARWGGWSTPRPGRFTPWKDPVPNV